MNQNLEQSPRHIEPLEGTARGRLERARKHGFPRGRKDQNTWKRWRNTGPYYWHRHQRAEDETRQFYLGSMGQPSPRWAWADHTDPTIRHTGWFCDVNFLGFKDGSVQYEPDTGGEKYRGIVFSLPHGLYLPGCSMGEGMTGCVETREAYTNDVEAARAADELARVMADQNIEATAADEQKRYDNAENIISRLPYERVVELLTAACIHVDPDEDVGDLREALWQDVAEGGFYELGEAEDWGAEL